MDENRYSEAGHILRDFLEHAMPRVLPSLGFSQVRQFLAYPRLLSAHRTALPSCERHSCKGIGLDSYGAWPLANRLAAHQSHKARLRLSLLFHDLPRIFVIAQSDEFSSGSSDPPPSIPDHALDAMPSQRTAQFSASHCPHLIPRIFGMLLTEGFSCVSIVPVLMPFIPRILASSFNYL